MTIKYLSVSRKELKFLINLEDRMRLIAALDQLLYPDAYGSYDGYRVRSVYLDGLDNQDYIERKNKFDFKKRVRIRAYSAEDETAKFEIKKKWNHGQVKESVIIQREDAQAILSGNYEVLKKYDSPTAELGYEVMSTMGYRPVSLVEYKRRAYTHPMFSTRITLDNELRYAENDKDLFTDEANFKSVLAITDTILEVKYDTYLLPYIQDVLSELDLKPCPISKFASSRAVLEEYYA